MNIKALLALLFLVGKGNLPEPAVTVNNGDFGYRSLPQEGKWQSEH